MLGKTEGRKRREWTTQDEMVGWHYQLSGYESEKTLEDKEGQGGLPCYSLWRLKDPHKI